MPLPIEDDHRALADSAAAFARRHAPMAATRAALPDLAAGGRPPWWDALVRQGLHAVHLPEEHGGAGAGLMELAVVVEQLGRALVPGPFVPTAIAGAVVAASPASAVRDRLLAAYAGGATGALVTTPGLTARHDPDGWRVDGSCLPVLGLPGAEEVVARAAVAGDPSRALWFRLAPAETAVVHVDEGTDLTRSVGRLELADHRVAPDDVLEAPDQTLADLAVNTVLAAEAAGIASWCLATAVEYVRTRVQFGRPVGAFQAVQHKAALMLVRTETACAAAWDAARAEHQPAAQRRLAAAAAAVTALPAGIDAAFECVMMHGGIGFTWEHDAHLYWRRALSIASACGAEEQWAHRLGEAARTDARDFAFVAEDAFPELRNEVRRVLDEIETLPATPGEDDRYAVRGGPRRARLAEAGLVAPHYPAPYGLAAGPGEQSVIAEEFARRGLHQPTTVIGEWVLPTLLAHGRPEQQERFVMPTLRGEIVWCQLFSEPGAGSDLAALSTRAARVPGGWSLTGQKVWTSGAHEADWGVCLARTDPDAPKHRGLSYFLVDMRAPGIDVRPLRQSTGRAEFNEVFLDDVFVPDECLVSEPGRGWRLAATTLSNERLSMGGMLTHGSAETVRMLIERGDHAASRDEAVRVLGRNTAREMALSALGLRGVLARLSDHDPGAEISVQKVFNAIAQRDGSRALVSLLGPAGTVAGGGYAIDHIGLPSVLFGGGTIEIQLNVIAQRVLGLPRQDS
ncbi:acyl-CoA dehydrogenase [Actinomadura verrucosospora]|uniref:Acyl-CoA dehydrogenase n=1 Tax=Actinomadura verrucosospora TaxID=46165 RepID=A0A7D3VSR7_ACTVE|nr:acyl-CoA dehydrogenase [Actinomadura verrucosospora]QKG19954.1 acyl-CoA dehydrogenase [Actinomadura verrucosospora]